MNLNVLLNMVASPQTCCPEQEVQQTLGEHSGISQVRHSLKGSAMEARYRVQTESATPHREQQRASTFHWISGVLAGTTNTLTSH